MRYLATLSDGRTFFVDIPTVGDRLGFGFVDGTQLEATGTDAYVIGQALVNSAISVGQRNARRRDQKTAARERLDTRRRLADAGDRNRRRR